MNQGLEETLTVTIKTPIKFSEYFHKISKMPQRIKILSLINNLVQTNSEALWIIKEEGKKLSIMRWTTPKRSRSMPFARMMDLLTEKADYYIAIIPIVKAEGNSLNNAKKIPGGTVEDGDYVVIDGKNRNPSDGAYVLSVIDDCANIKRFYRKGDQIILISESKSDIPPIYIHSKDFPDYMVNGVVARVIKKPKLK